MQIKNVEQIKQLEDRKADLCYLLKIKAEELNILIKTAELMAQNGVAEDRLNNFKKYVVEPLEIEIAVVEQDVDEIKDEIKQLEA